MTTNELEDYYSNFSNESLEKYHASASRAYQSDQALNSEQITQVMMSRSCVSNYYDTDSVTDWPMHVRAIESVMLTRGITFMPIPMSRLAHLL